MSAHVADPWLSAREIVAHFGITKETVRGRNADEALPAQSIGQLWRLQVTEVDVLGAQRRHGVIE